MCLLLWTPQKEKEFNFRSLNADTEEQDALSSQEGSQTHGITFSFLSRKINKNFHQETNTSSHKTENRHSLSIHLNWTEDFEWHAGFWYFKKQYLHEESIMPKTRKWCTINIHYMPTLKKKERKCKLPSLFWQSCTTWFVFKAKFRKMSLNKCKSLSNWTKTHKTEGKSTSEF